jgi:hypothetical protein
MKTEKSGHVATTGAGEGNTQQRCVLCGASTELTTEMAAYLDSLTITSDNIGDIRRSCFVPWQSRWNGIVRDETAKRELSPATVAEGKPDMQPKCVHCQNAITRHRHSGTWIHAGTGLITCRTLLGSKHDGINHAEPGPSTPTTGAGARELSWLKQVPMKDQWFISGYYFQRRSNHALQVVHVNQHGASWVTGNSSAVWLSDLHSTGDYEWLGPITPEALFPPTEATQVAVEAEKPQYDLDPLEFWQDLAEALGHPRPTKADVPALVSEVAELRTRYATARSNAIRECVDESKKVIAGWRSDVDESWDERPDLSFEAADKIAGAKEIIRALESLTKKEGDDGPTKT